MLFFPSLAFFTSPDLAPELFTLWADTDAPVSPNSNDTDSVNLGILIRCSSPVVLRGIRFYKHPNNIGTHIGGLWLRSSSLKLNECTFENETSQGWQTQLFTTPSILDAETTYTVAYLAPKGFYSSDNGYFNNRSQSKTVQGITVSSPADGLFGNNGTYRYDSTSEIPTASFQSSHYWVDIIFSLT
jgi:hypothetical protein